MVALVLVVLALATEGTGDGVPVMDGHLGLAAGVGLLLLFLEFEALVLVAIWGMHQAALLVSVVTLEEVLNTAHVASSVRG